MKLANVDVRDKAKWYETRRDELLQLLQRTAELGEIPEKYVIELANIRKKCQENQFEIVLVSEFQGGKSTTFDALCDGRDLSPRGLGGGGIKTSAAKISAQNISDGETRNGMEEWAEIDFKSKYDIQKTMFDILREPLAQDEVFRREIIDADKSTDEEDFAYRISQPKFFPELLDMDNVKHREAVKRALKYWWGIYLQDRSSLDEDTKDQLRIATLLERFYGTPEYRRLIEKTVTGVDDFQKMVAFPIKWNEKWEDCENAEFSFDEVTFVFVAQVLLRIKSENLARLGCRITDCPGLRANAYDTMVAESAILHSDAVWYLLGNGKTIGLKDKESLRTIRDMGMQSKMTVSVNWRENYRTQMEIIVPDINSSLKNSGFDFEALPYNARLAFLAFQGKRIFLDGCQLSSFAEYCIKKDSNWPIDEKLDVKKAWIKMARRSGFSYDIEEMQDMDGSDADAIAVVRKYSNIDELMEYLNEEIISKKTRSILIDNGSRKAADAMQELEGILKRSEDAATQSEEKWRAKVDGDRKKLEEFIEKSNEIIEDSPLGKNCEQCLLAKGLAEELAKRVTERHLFVTKVSNMFAVAIVNAGDIGEDAKKTKIIYDVTPELTKFVEISITRIIHGWASGDDTDSTYWQSYQWRIEKVKKDIGKLWGDYNIDGLTLNLPKSFLDYDEFTKLLDEILNIDAIRSLWDPPGWKRLLTGLFLGVENILTISISCPEKLKKKKIAQYTKIIADEMKTRIENFRDHIGEAFEKTFETSQYDFVNKLKTSIENLKGRFENDRIKPAERILGQSEKKRREIAERNRKIRTEQIEPLRKEIREFEQQVSQEINA